MGSQKMLCERLFPHNIKKGTRNSSMRMNHMEVCVITPTRLFDLVD